MYNGKEKNTSRLVMSKLGTENNDPNKKKKALWMSVVFGSTLLFTAEKST